MLIHARDDTSAGGRGSVSSWGHLLEVSCAYCDRRLRECAEKNITRLCRNSISCCSYDIGGYQLPFLLGAGLAFIDVLVVALLMDDAAAVASAAPVPDDETEFSWRDVLKHRCETRASVKHSRP
jgi:hypothetical protein